MLSPPAHACTHMLTLSLHSPHTCTHACMCAGVHGFRLLLDCIQPHIAALARRRHHRPHPHQHSTPSPHTAHTAHVLHGRRMHQQHQQQQSRGHHQQQQPRGHLQQQQHSHHAAGGGAGNVVNGSWQLPRGQQHSHQQLHTSPRPHAQARPRPNQTPQHEHSDTSSHGTPRHGIPSIHTQHSHPAFTPSIHTHPRYTKHSHPAFTPIHGIPSPAAPCCGQPRYSQP